MSMSALVEIAPSPFVDRRTTEPQNGSIARERRQFANSHEDLSPAARELAQAVDAYKLTHHRRFVTYEELLDVVQSLGYQK